MYKQNQLENLEIKLKNAREENAEVFEQIEEYYNEKYRDFVESFFKTDVLGAKKTISALFQLEMFNGKDAKDSLASALDKGLKVLPIAENKRKLLAGKIIKLESKKKIITDIITKNSKLEHSTNSPILESLLEQKIINNEDMLIISTAYQSSRDIRLSLSGISKEKREAILKYFYELNSTRKEERITNFKQEYHSEISSLENKYSGPIINGVVNFVGRNFFKMKPYKKKIESKKERLRRSFKIALLKLLRIKYSGFNIDTLLKKIDTLDDFESMFKLIQKLIDIIPENTELIEKFSIQEEIDEVESVVQEAEGNKKKILDGEEITIKTSKIMSETEQKLDKKLLDKLLDDDTDIVGGELKFRKNTNNILAKPLSGILTPSQEQGATTLTNGGNLLDGAKNAKMNAGILNPPIITFIKGDEQESEEDDEEILGEEELEQVYRELKLEYNLAEKKKQTMFAHGDYDTLDEINEEILGLMIKMEKVNMLLGNKN